MHIEYPVIISVSIFFSSVFANQKKKLGKSGHVARQYFPYVSSESDLQRYKAISFRQNSTNVSSDQHGSSTLSNVPSEYKSDRHRVSNIQSACFFSGFYFYFPHSTLEKHTYTFSHGK